MLRRTVSVRCTKPKKNIPVCTYHTTVPTLRFGKKNRKEKTRDHFNQRKNFWDDCLGRAATGTAENERIQFLGDAYKFMHVGPYPIYNSRKGEMRDKPKVTGNMDVHDWELKYFRMFPEEKLRYPQRLTPDAKQWFVPPVDRFTNRLKELMTTHKFEEKRAWAIAMQEKAWEQQAIEMEMEVSRRQAEVLFGIQSRDHVDEMRRENTSELMEDSDPRIVEKFQRIQERELMEMIESRIADPTRKKIKLEDVNKTWKEIMDFVSRFPEYREHFDETIYFGENPIPLGLMEARDQPNLNLSLERMDMGPEAHKLMQKILPLVSVLVGMFKRGTTMADIMKVPEKKKFSDYDMSDLLGEKGQTTHLQELTKSIWVTLGSEGKRGSDLLAFLLRNAGVVNYKKGSKYAEEDDDEEQEVPLRKQGGLEEDYYDTNEETIVTRQNIAKLINRVFQRTQAGENIQEILGLNTPEGYVKFKNVQDSFYAKSGQQINDFAQEVDDNVDERYKNLMNEIDAREVAEKKESSETESADVVAERKNLSEKKQIELAKLAKAEAKRAREAALAEEDDEDGEPRGSLRENEGGPPDDDEDMDEMEEDKREREGFGDDDDEEFDATTDFEVMHRRAQYQSEEGYINLIDNKLSEWSVDMLKLFNDKVNINNLDGSDPKERERLQQEGLKARGLRAAMAAVLGEGAAELALKYTHENVENFMGKEDLTFRTADQMHVNKIKKENPYMESTLQEELDRIMKDIRK